MSDEGRDEAFSLIHDIALKLMLRDNIPEEVRTGLDQIASLARYQFNVLRDDELKRTLGDEVDSED